MEIPKEKNAAEMIKESRTKREFMTERGAFATTAVQWIEEVSSFFFFQVEKIKEAREENHLRCGVIQEEQQTTTTMRRTPLLAPCQKF